ncbi:response regulator [Myroides odoratus]|uniref:response regulator n=1 Tax=Myroides odoratus TaxID=256 RepID=UPI0039B0CB33
MYKKEKLILAIVDDHPMILEGIKSLLSHANFQLFTFTKGTALLDFIQSNPVDIVLLDIILSDGNGLDFCKSIKQQFPTLIVLGLSNQTERSIIFRFLENGANGYILKNADPEEILEGIEKAIQGDLILSKEVQEIILRSTPLSFEIPKLTKREHQILQAIAQGDTSAVIAQNLFISLVTVETHRRNLLQKFKAKNMIELVKIATENKLI